MLLCSSLSAGHPSPQVVDTAPGPGPGDDGGPDVASGGGGDHIAEGLGGQGGLNVDVGLGGDLLVNVGLGGDLLVHIGHDLGGGHSAGDHGEEDLAAGGLNGFECQGSMILTKECIVEVWVGRLECN